MAAIKSLFDDELVSLIRAGDHAAFTQLYERYSLPMYVNILKMVKDSDIAEEMVQEIFTRVWKKRDSLLIETSFAAYLYRIGQNLVHDFYRKLQRDQKLYAHFKAIATEHYSHIEEALMLKENEGVLKAALAKLSPQQRQVYQLCKLDGHTYKEAAALLSISPHTVKEYLTKANALVKAHMLANLDTSMGLMILLLLKKL